MSDPVHDAWLAAGSPQPAQCPAYGQCARCGTAGPAAPWRDVLSANFGDWDKLRWRQSGVLCPACSWGFGCKPLRTRAHVITAGSCEAAAPAALLAVLSRPVHRGVLVSVPVAGKKHIVPYARYGMVVTDHEELSWDAGDARRLGIAAGLRGLGFGEAALAEPAPRWVILRRLSPADRAGVITLWPALAPWRGRPSYLAVACRATRTPKEEPADA